MRGLFLLALAPLILSGGLLARGTELLILLAFAQSWNMVAGPAGMLSLGHHAFYAIGGYALFAPSAGGLHPWAALPLAGLVAGLAGVLMSPLVLRLRGPGFAVGLWALAEALRLAIARLDVFGGSSGLPLRAARALNRAWMGPVAFWLALGLALLVSFALARGLGGFALHLRALRDDEVAARAMGLAAGPLRVAVFAASATVAGAAGALSFLTTLFITPAAAFDMTRLATVVFVVLIGGLGRAWGPVLGIALWAILRETLSFAPGAAFAGLGVLAILVTLYAPKGLAGYLNLR